MRRGEGRGEQSRFSCKEMVNMLNLFLKCRY